MLLVKTTLKTSLIPGAGLGCFAAEFIPEGTVIWEFNPLIDKLFTQSDVEQFTKLEQEFINTYCYKHDGLYYLCVDNGRFINHSNNPNTREDVVKQTTIAYRDIRIDEEIVSNYAHFGVTPEDANHNILKEPNRVYIDRRTNDYIH
jgi:SET domain-containing protein